MGDASDQNPSCMHTIQSFSAQHYRALRQTDSIRIRLRRFTFVHAFSRSIWQVDAVPFEFMQVLQDLPLVSEDRLLLLIFEVYNRFSLSSALQGYHCYLPGFKNRVGSEANKDASTRRLRRQRGPNHSRFLSPNADDFREGYTDSPLISFHYSLSALTISAHTTHVANLKEKAAAIII